MRLSFKAQPLGKFQGMILSKAGISHSSLIQFKLRMNEVELVIEFSISSLEVSMKFSCLKLQCYEIHIDILQHQLKTEAGVKS